MGEYSSENRGFRFLLTVIDTFSKYAWCEAIESKNAIDVVKAMEAILSSGRRPKNLQTDHGKEFYNKRFKNLMEKYNINHYSSFTTLKASIVERFNRTLKGLMWRSFSFQGNYKWLSLYKQLVDTYNKSYHRTIKMSPNEVNSSKQKLLLKTVYNNLKVFKAG